jgi:hypothetical protein
MALASLYLALCKIGIVDSRTLLQSTKKGTEITLLLYEDPLGIK